MENSKSKSGKEFTKTEQIGTTERRTTQKEISSERDPNRPKPSVATELAMPL